ncbi:hypothetical protein DL769_004220 [Monosporascus sp. CRB-8-3]|nr:hypothetical protein DL769_004220 [Monosporascus sp. CRB-8-3]
MDITTFFVSARNQALLYGDYSTYHRQLAKKLHNCRKKLNLSTRNRGKFSKRSDVTPSQIAENHGFVHLLLLTAERDWAQAMRYKAVHSTDAKGIAGRTRTHIISRLDKGARIAEQLVRLLSDASTSGASDVDILEARAYASLIRGATQFEKQDWKPCVQSYSTSRIIYIALSSSIRGDTFKDLLSETIDPSIQYAAYQSKIPRTLAVPTIARKAFPSSDDALVEQINKFDPSLLKQTGPDAQQGQVGAANAPQTITWRSRQVKIEDAAIAVALAATDTATAQLAEKLESSDVILPKEMAAAYDGVLIASQDAADATKHAIDDLKEEGVSQNDARIQSLQITRTAVNYQMISWRIGRNRVLSGEHDGALLDSAPNTTRKSKKDATSRKPKPEAPGRKIARLREKVVLYDSTLQSIDSIKDLPGVAADEGLLEQLGATINYFHALKSLSIARSHSLIGQSLNALALTKHAFDEIQQPAAFFSKHGSSASEYTPQNIEIRQSDVRFLHNLLKGELQRCRAIVEIDNLRAKSNSTASKVKIPLIQRFSEYPAEGVDLENLVTYPPKVEPIPVKPLFFDVAWNYVAYPGKTLSVVEETPKKQEEAAPPQKKGWFSFGSHENLLPSIHRDKECPLSSLRPSLSIKSMPGHRPSSSLTKLMFEHDDPEQPPEPTGSATTRKSSSSPSAFTPEKQQRPRRTVFLCVFVSSLLCFCVLALALGLGLGLGLGRRRDRAAYAHPPPLKYSNYYGIPEDLESVPIERLVNATELDLDTDFSVEGAGARPAVREYVFNVSQALAAPDGFQKPMILVNGQSPGPLIEANTGDTVRVHVNNLMANWSTTIHWHGIDQKGTTWMDGVVGVSQCGIPPGRSFTYEFRVIDQRGTFWWHAHLSVIHDPDEMVPETDAEKIIFVSDVYHTHGSVLLASYLNPTSKWVPFESGVEPLPDNLLLNGQNTYDCSVTSTTYPPEERGGSAPPRLCTGGRRYATRVRPGSAVRLRLINASSFLSYWFSIDNHMLTIVELDGVEVAPLEGQRGVYLNVGQRVSVVVRADAPGPPGNYMIRATLPRTCFLPYAPYASAGLERSAAYEARGVLSYDGAPDPDPDEPIGIVGGDGGSGGRNTSNPYGVENNGVRGDVWEGCDDMPFDVPKPMRAHRAVEVSSEANVHYIEYMFRQAQDVNRIFINKTAYSPLPNNATLWKALEQDFTAESANSYNSWDFGLNQQVLLIPEADKGVQIVINSRDAMEHPWHLQYVSSSTHPPILFSTRAPSSCPTALDIRLDAYARAIS